MGATETDIPELIKFENLSEQDLDSFLGETVVDETLGSWYYDNIFCYYITLPDRMEELGFVKDFEERKYYFSLFPLSINGEHFTDEDKEYMQFMIDTHELDTLVNANEIYRNKRIIYYDRDEGCVCMGIIQSVSLKESPNPRDESEKHKCLDFIINGKKYEYKYFNNDSDIMIDHGLSYDGALPEEIVFGSFDNALKKLESYNKGEKSGDFRK